MESGRRTSNDHHMISTLLPFVFKKMKSIKASYRECIHCLFQHAAENEFIAELPLYQRTISIIGDRFLLVPPTF